MKMQMITFSGTWFMRLTCSCFLRLWDAFMWVSKSTDHEPCQLTDQQRYTRTSQGTEAMGSGKIPTNPLSFLRLLVPPAPLEELTEALQGHDDSVVSPLLTAAETIIASRSNCLIFQDGSNGSQGTNTIFSWYFMMFQVCFSVRWVLFFHFLLTETAWQLCAGIGAAIHQAKCLVLLLLDQFVFEILLSTPAAKGQCGGHFDALLHLILHTEVLAWYLWIPWHYFHIIVLFYRLFRPLGYCILCMSFFKRAVSRMQFQACSIVTWTRPKVWQ